jgi:hypothetical protein
MSRRTAPIYPAYTFNQSRTWFNWVKLTAADVHGLREEPGFQGKPTHLLPLEKSTQPATNLY